MNKGEWSEFYTFLKLLSDGKLYAANSDLKKCEDLYYPVIKIIRQSSQYDEPLYYICDDQVISITESDNSAELKKIPREKFSTNADILLSKILSSRGSFDVEEIEQFIDEIASPQIKEKSSSKRDITVHVHDINTGYNPEVGFSIKSKLGGDSTLFNASGRSNIKYSIDGLKGLEKNTLNEIADLKAKKLLNSLIDNNCSIDYETIENDFFKSNLQMIDSSFPLILAEMIKLYYSGVSKNINELTDVLCEANPCNFANCNEFPFYEHKIKNFLTACALGMTPQKAWSGVFEASGGYIIVKEDGDLVCFHIYNWNDFQDYLFNNTYIDTPSTSRHKFGTLDGDKLKLNFQIRFK